MYAPRALLQLGIAGHSWELAYAQLPVHKALSVLFPEKLLPLSQVVLCLGQGPRHCGRFSFE